MCPFLTHSTVLFYFNKDKIKTLTLQQIESLDDDKRGLARQLNDSEIARKTLRAECEVLGDARDNIKNYCINLEKDKTHADMLLEEAKKTIGSIESQLNDVEQRYTNLQGL